jgi:hypothetical protein
VPLSSFVWLPYSYKRSAEEIYELKEQVIYGETIAARSNTASSSEEGKPVSERRTGLGF